MLRWLSIRSKLLLLVALPLVPLLGFTALAASDAARRAVESEQIVEDVDVVLDVTLLVHELQRERDLADRYATERTEANRDDFQRQTGRLDGLRQIALASIGGLPPQRQSVYDEALASLDAIDQHRRAELGSPTGTASEPYSETITDLLDGNATFARATDDPELRQSLDAAVALARAKEAFARQRGLLHRALTAGTWDDQSFAEANRLDAAEQAQTDVFELAASPEEVRRFVTRVEGRAAETAREIRDQTLTTAVGAPFADTPEDWFRSASQRLDLIKDVEDVLAENVATAAAEHEDAANRTRVEVLSLALGMVTLVVVLGYATARSISTPVRRLTTRATRMAENELPAYVAAVEQGEAVPTPDPIPVTSRDELGALATAYNALQGAVLSLSAQQAETRRQTNEVIVDLGRRNQAMLGRQLAMIDRLERDEEDPDTLAELFRIDHLTNRMRRNADSLLVVAGATELSRSGGAVPLEDAIRIAVGEVEDYARVDIVEQPVIALSPTCARDVIHLLAELVENATTFSPPTSRVTVRAERRGTGCQLEIIDRGIGMAPEALAAANTRLTDWESLDIRALGLSVVGRLAARHEIEVSLRPTPEGGATASIQLTAATLVEPEATPSSTLPSAPPSTPPPAALSTPSSTRPGPAQEDFTVIVDEAPALALVTTGSKPPAPLTNSGLPVRTRHASVTEVQVFDLGMNAMAPRTEARNPEAIRDRFAAIQRGTERGRAGADHDETSHDKEPIS